MISIFTQKDVDISRLDFKHMAVNIAVVGEGRPTGIVPIDHGMGAEAKRLGDELHKLGSNFFMYQNPNARRPADHCIQQWAIADFHAERRPIITPPRYVSKFTHDNGIEVLFGIDEMVKRGSTARGAEQYFLRYSPHWGIKPKDIWLGAFVDHADSVDVSLYGNNTSQYRQDQIVHGRARDHFRDHARNNYFDLLEDEVIEPMPGDEEFIANYANARFPHRARRYVARLANKAFRPLAVAVGELPVENIRHVLGMQRSPYLKVSLENAYARRVEALK